VIKRGRPPGSTKAVNLARKLELLRSQPPASDGAYITEPPANLGEGSEPSERADGPSYEPPVPVIVRPRLYLPISTSGMEPAVWPQDVAAVTEGSGSVSPGATESLGDVASDPGQVDDSSASQMSDEGFVHIT
jgi:hypothetical protein